MGIDIKYMGYKGKGLIILYYVSLRMYKLIGEKIKRGFEFRFVVIFKLNDLDFYGVERIVVKNIVFDDLILVDWEVGVKGEIEVFFIFIEYDFFDII